MAMVSGVCLWKVFLVQECSRRKESGKAVRKASKEGKGFYTQGDICGCCDQCCLFSLLSAIES